MRVIDIPLNATGIRLAGDIYTLTQTPILTINLEHGSWGLRGRRNFEAKNTKALGGYLFTPSFSVLVAEVGNQYELHGSDVASNTSYGALNFGKKGRVYTEVLNNKAFFYIKDNNILFRTDLNTSAPNITSNPFTLPTAWNNNFYTIGKHANRIWISHRTEPILARGNPLAISGAVNVDDFWGIADPEPFVYIGDLSTSSVGNFRTNLVLIQKNGLCLMYHGTNPGTDYSLQVKAQIKDFLYQIQPVNVFTEIYVATLGGIYPLKELVSRTATEIVKLNLVEPILPLYSAMVDYFTSMQYDENTASLYLFYNCGINVEQPLAEILNSPSTEDYYNLFVGGYSWIEINLLLGTIAIFTHYLDIPSVPPSSNLYGYEFFYINDKQYFAKFTL